ncbi:hypothetical protein K503DRAFT_229441 [Rhizopogon vinicolor AM-OR11-026]|uniref:Uncharacterized protein n=1 Tax=Rhizopogon vinicolor AM-OR11-026 TaxID=1314800 RepID=A0A1B7MY12_9AGAM|nr:hypothetical protein K503DRAFT_229441 [Rhizopogon vinicolor AM-OR11-026]
MISSTLSLFSLVFLFLTISVLARPRKFYSSLLPKFQFATKAIYIIRPNESISLFVRPRGYALILKFSRRSYLHTTLARGLQDLDQSGPAST